MMAFLDAMLPEQREDALQHLAAPRPAEFLFDGEQADFADLAVRRQVGVEVGKFLVEREWPVASHREHAGEFLIAETDQVRIFRVELVHQALRRRRLVLRNLLDECAVVEPVNLLELPVVRGDLEHER